MSELTSHAPSPGSPPGVAVRTKLASFTSSSLARAATAEREGCDMQLVVDQGAGWRAKRTRNENSVDILDGRAGRRRDPLEPHMIEQLFSLKDSVALVTGRVARDREDDRGRLRRGRREGVHHLAQARGVVATARELASAGRCVAIPHDISTLDGCRALTADYLAHEPSSTFW